MENALPQFPIATYRIQLNKKFTFQNAEDAVIYLKALGISHLYASPFFQAKNESIHGYDIIDHSAINRELGSLDEFHDFANFLHQQNMGLICDFIPNHIYIGDATNKWWYDVLENGPASPYANYFDFSWLTPHAKIKNKVLLPLLDQFYHEALENKKIQISYKNKEFFLNILKITLPTDPRSWRIILQELIKRIKTPTNEVFEELKSIYTSVVHLPKNTDCRNEKIEERRREKKIIKNRLSKLISDNLYIAEQLDCTLETMNGIKNIPTSFNCLEKFLNIQPYYLCYWTIANEELNYRRFFDLFEYAGIRTELPEVFHSITSKLLELIENNIVDGLRIDHIDGLWDPLSFLKLLRKHCKKVQPQKDLFLVVEKVLIGKEKIAKDWPIEGSVGYDFLNYLNGLFIKSSNQKVIEQIYYNFTGIPSSVTQLMFDCKKLILSISLSSEFYMLFNRIQKIAKFHRNSRDFSEESLREVLRNVIACFPVYRTYLTADTPIDIHDRKMIISSIKLAKKVNPSIHSALYDFIQHVLLLEYPDEIGPTHQKEYQDFVMRFQQLTGPVMAKGIEDTAFYRFYPLVSLNEVGANLKSFGISIEQFHQFIEERAATFPHSLNATTTHDTKRSEDVRAIINVLSEIPNEWEKVLAYWSRLNNNKKFQEEDFSIPNANEEYLLYQTIIGTWPSANLNKTGLENYLNRIKEYMLKALKEAKINTSWIHPNVFYIQKIEEFIDKIFSEEESAEFLNSLATFSFKISQAGALNSLSQVIVKLTAPGIPDIYQGNEKLQYFLVDPDNRRPINFEEITLSFQNLESGWNKKNKLEFIQELMKTMQDGRLKLFFTSQLLLLRQRLYELFTFGTYIPLKIEGEKSTHIIAFARIFDNKAVLIFACRFFMSLIDHSFIPSETWKDNKVQLPDFLVGKPLNHFFTGKQHICTSKIMDLEEFLNPFPFAIMETI